MDMHLSKLRSWWWTRKPGMLQSMGSQRVGHDWATEQQHIHPYTVSSHLCVQDESTTYSHNPISYLFYYWLLIFSWQTGSNLLYHENNSKFSISISSVSQSWLTLCNHMHTRLPCPSPFPGACSNSCPSSRWCHPTISSSVVPFSSCLQSFPASGSCLTWAYRYHLGKYFFQSCPDNGHTLIINCSVKLSLICQQNKSQTIFLTQN